jgi:hypothetical protein
MRTQLQHDLMYDPEAWSAHLAYYGMCQFGGMSTLTVLALCFPRSNDDNWGDYTWAGSQPGYGLSNQFWIDDSLGHDDTNEAPRGQAWRDWADVANVAPITVPFVCYVDPFAVSQDATGGDAVFGAGIDPFAVAQDAPDEDAEFGVGIDPFAVSH